jgi:hypothetical protein
MHTRVAAVACCGTVLGGLDLTLCHFQKPENLFRNFRASFPVSEIWHTKVGSFLLHSRRPQREPSAGSSRRCICRRSCVYGIMRQVTELLVSKPFFQQSFENDIHAHSQEHCYRDLSTRYLVRQRCIWFHNQRRTLPHRL